MSHKTGCKFLVGLTLVICAGYPSYGELLYQWPLGDTSMLADVIHGNDLSAAGNDQCFLLGDRYPQLNGGSISLSKDATEYVEVNLSTKEPFKDLTISILVHQEGAVGGTLFNYVENDIEKFNMRFISSTAVVSFRDEFDNPAGLIPIVELLVAGWNHIVVQRIHRTGEIRVYNNGIQKVKMDEDFPDNTTILQGGGMFMVGNSPKEPDQQFTGSIACLQIFTEVLSSKNVVDCWKMCLPQHWLVIPSVALAPDPNNPKKHCLVDPPPVPEDNVDIVSLSMLTNEALWIQTKQRYKWKDSKRNSCYFSLVSRDKPTSVIAPLGVVNATNVHVCSRLCMRVEGCESFVIDKMTLNSRLCYLYNSVSKNLVNGNGAKYYSIRK